MQNLELRSYNMERFLRGHHKKIKLLSKSNPKLDSSVPYGYLTAGLTLMPAQTATRKNLCPMAQGCLKSCLVYSGQGEEHLKRKDGRQWALDSRALKSIYYENDLEGFLKQLDKELLAHKRKSERLGLKPVARLNVSTDILWDRHGVFDRHEDIMFYTYTKIPTNIPTHKNSHVTFSRDETNEHLLPSMIENGVNVSVVFEKHLPKEYLGYEVIDGVSHDLRFLDKKGVVVGLVAKGSKAKSDGLRSGFIVRQSNSNVLIDRLAA